MQEMQPELVKILKYRKHTKSMCMNSLKNLSLKFNEI